MDPERIHAYLQAACAGLGFDIGEVWRITGPGTVTSKSEDSGEYKSCNAWPSSGTKQDISDYEIKPARILSIFLIFF